MSSIRVDGVAYRVRIVYNSMTRAFELKEGQNAGDMISYRRERDLIGTAYSYELQVEPDPSHPEDYDRLYEVLSQPVDSHKVTLPYGQETITFQAQITSGTDHFGGKLAGVNRWHGLRIQYEPLKPQKLAAQD